MMKSSSPPLSPKPKRGRPPTEKGQRSERLLITLHTDELDLLREVAKKPITFVREAALEKARVILGDKDRG